MRLSLLLLLVVGVAWVKGLELCHPQCHCLDTFFDCRKRSLTTFPHDFPPWIQKLNVSFNQISSVDGNHLVKLKNLQSLALDSNNLTEIPRPSGELHQLTVLSLSRNALSQVTQDDLAHFPALQELDVSRNKLTVIASNAFPSANSPLRALNFGSNQIENLEDGCFNGLENAEEIVLGRNRIRTLPKILFSKNSKLERLDLSRNKLEVLDSLRFQDLSSLQILNLRRNGLRNMSDAAFYGLDKLQHLYLDGNRIIMIERRWLYGLRSLKTMNLSTNVIELIEDNCWDGMEELNFLDLSWNKITSLKKASFTGLHGLRVLDISHNQLSTLGQEAFIPLRNLEALDLSNNLLSWVLEDTSSPFKGLIDCKSLNLAGNLLQTLHSEALKGLASLSLLNVSSNPVKWLQAETFMKHPMMTVVLYNVTTFVCDCYSTWLHSRLSSQTQSRTFEGSLRTKAGRNRNRGVELLDPSIRNSPECSQPPSLAGKMLMDISFPNLTCSDDHSRPKFVVQPMSQTFLKEGNGSLSCLSESHSNAITTINWLKDHQPLEDSLVATAVKTYERIESNGLQVVNSSLTFVNASWTDQGLYQCRGENTFGVTYSTKANITIHIFPSFVKKPSNITVRLGSNAKLECGSKGFPVPEIAFQKDGGVDFPAALERRFHVMPNDDFMILDAQLMDQGVYCCSAKNAAGEIKSCASVTVYETPRFGANLKDERVVEGSSTVLECLASGGSPRPQISWSKDNALIHWGDDNSRIRLKENGSLLVIKDAKIFDSGRYECHLSNAVGTARDSLILTVIPGVNSDLPWNSLIFIVALAVVVICCVIIMLAGLLIMFRNKRNESCGNTALLATAASPPVSRPCDESLQRDGMEFRFLQQLSSPHLGEASLHSYSGKDSGTGDDIHLELDSVGHPELESLMGSSAFRRPELESFTTFGHHKCPSNVSNASTSSILAEGNVLFPRGRNGTLSLLKKVPIPVPPESHSSGVKSAAAISVSQGGGAPAISEEVANDDNHSNLRTSPCGSSGRNSAEEASSLSNYEPDLSSSAIPNKPIPTIEEAESPSDNLEPINYEPENPIIQKSFSISTAV